MDPWHTPSRSRGHERSSPDAWADVDALASGPPVDPGSNTVRLCQPSPGPINLATRARLRHQRPRAEHWRQQHRRRVTHTARWLEGPITATTDHRTGHVWTRTNPCVLAYAQRVRGHLRGSSRHPSAAPLPRELLSAAPWTTDLPSTAPAAADLPSTPHGHRPTSPGRRVPWDYGARPPAEVSARFPSAYRWLDSTPWHRAEWRFTWNADRTRLVLRAPRILRPGNTATRLRAG